MPRSNFLFLGAPADVPDLMSVVFAHGLRCVSRIMVKGRPQYFDRWGPQLADELERRRSLFLAGDFTVKVRSCFSATSIVDDSSGPLLYFRAPLVTVDFRNDFRRNFRSPTRDRPADSRLSFHYGLLNVRPTYYYPKQAGRDPGKEAQAAFRRLVTALKKAMIQEKGEWIGMTGYEWVMSGPADLG